MALGMVGRRARPTAFASRGQLLAAVDDWCANPVGAAATHGGHISTWDTSAVTDMSQLIHDCTCKTTFDENLSGWDTRSVTTMESMFQGAAAFNGDLSGWDTRSVTTMQAMFGNAAAFNGDLSGWDTRSVTTMESMFLGATTFNGDVSGWDTRSVTNMTAMFDGAAAFSTVRNPKKNWPGTAIEKLSGSAGVRSAHRGAEGEC